MYCHLTSKFHFLYLSLCVLPQIIYTLHSVSLCIPLILPSFLLLYLCLYFSYYLHSTFCISLCILSYIIYTPHFVSLCISHITLIPPSISFCVSSKISSTLHTLYLSLYPLTYLHSTFCNFLCISHIIYTPLSPHSVSLYFPSYYLHSTFCIYISLSIPSNLMYSTYFQPTFVISYYCVYCITLYILYHIVVCASSWLLYSATALNLNGKQNYDAWATDKPKSTVYTQPYSPLENRPGRWCTYSREQM